MQYWLMKTEPSVYSFDDLLAEGETPWEGVRNYQARNFMRDKMKLGDKVLFYHSNCKPPGIVGLAKVSKESYPDYFAFDPKSRYFDPKSNEEKPTWYMVSVVPTKKFDEIISLDTLKNCSELADMLVVQKGSRLSVQPVEKHHYDFIVDTLSKR